jgi:hypothetical protein
MNTKREGVVIPRERWAAKLSPDEKRAQLAHARSQNRVRLACLGEVARWLQKTEGAVKSGTNKVAIRCTYKNISGTQYHSVSEHDLHRDRFSTTFSKS